jgi:D-beta-D-heptose 7-phosphate kinase / D-beta-D-heptose 1-phosphate adenosyltransferase
MSYVLVVGDYIDDSYWFCEATRLCPEAPVPVLVPQCADSRPGGAALVAAQLDALKIPVRAHYGSFSRKERIFAGSRLICRVDEDRLSQLTGYEARHRFENRVIRSLKNASALVISDYDKGALTEPTAARFLRVAAANHIPVFVDAKHNWHWYEDGAFCLFPNEKELIGFAVYQGASVIRKLGARGCEVDGVLVPTIAQQEFDVSGAGDVFLAAFVAEYLSSISEQDALRGAAEFANRVAGISVQHVGTHVVTWEEIGC